MTTDTYLAIIIGLVSFFVKRELDRMREDARLLADEIKTKAQVLDATSKERNEAIVGRLARIEAYVDRNK